MLKQVTWHFEERVDAWIPVGDNLESMDFDYIKKCMTDKACPRCKTGTLIATHFYEVLECWRCEDKFVFKDWK